jgi:hypothetical protein
VKIIILIASILIIGSLGSFSQDAFSSGYVDTLPSMKVALKTIPFFYQDSEGYTVVTGLIENRNELSTVTNVRIHVSFYDETRLTPTEVAGGNTLMDIIPPNGEAPFAIRSQNPLSDIEDVSVKVLGFDPTQNKINGLIVGSDNATLNSMFSFSGSLDTIGAPSSNTNVYFAFYDSFEPPRILKVSTVELGDIDSNTKILFEHHEKVDPKVSGVLLFAESDIFYSDIIDAKISLSEITIAPKDTPFTFRYDAPAFQIKYQNIQPYEVQCNNPRELVFKTSLDYSACVYPSSVGKLIERGWILPSLK